MSVTENCANRTRRHRWLLSWLPVTLQPKVIGFKNRYLSRKRIGFSDICALGMTALLMIGLYYGAWNTLRELGRTQLQGNLGSSMLFGFTLGLFMLIFLSAAVTGLSNLFMARDVDLLLASPVTDTSFLRGKTLEVLVSTTWMIVVFSIPPYVAFGQHFGAGTPFFLIAPIFVGLFLLVAVLAGMSVAIVCSSLIPARTGRNILVGLFVVVLGVILALVNASPNMQLHTQLFKKSSDAGLNALITNPLLPSTWLANILLGLIGRPATLTITPVALLGTTIIALWGVLMVTFRLLYHCGYSRLHTQPRASILLCRSGARRSRLLSLPFWQIPRALATRELFSFGRDITHTVQLALFLTICILYFINFHNIATPVHVGTWVLRAWDLIAIVSFLMISSLIVLSICSRFVFPSVSLEGSSLWILQVAPITPRALLRAKYFTWAIPVGLICAVLFSSAGLALALEPLCILTLGLAACIITHGLVALGIGLGAHFSRFDWEHPAELATSWGSLLFLVTGLVMVAVSFVPLCAAFGCYLFFPALFDNTGTTLALFSSGLGVLLLIHVIVGKIALKIGATALTKALAGSNEMRRA